jgi:methylmalonyl-CoA mutase cobalamin-binding domain/chain
MKVIIAKLGFDTHSWGLDNLAYAVERAGHTAVYLGRMNTPEKVVKAAVEEDVDAIFLSFYHLNHFGWTKDVKSELEANDRGDIDLVVGGIIPRDDHATLEEKGVIVHERKQPVIEFLDELSNRYEDAADSSYV